MSGYAIWMLYYEMWKIAYGTVTNYGTKSLVKPATGKNAVVNDKPLGGVAK